MILLLHRYKSQNKNFISFYPELILPDSLMNSDSSSLLSKGMISGICILNIWSKLDCVSWIKVERIVEFDVKKHGAEVEPILDNLQIEYNDLIDDPSRREEFLNSDI